LCALLGSCEPGPGGTAGITGLVYYQEQDAYGLPLPPYPAPDERVFIVYGQDSVVSDDARTHFSGRYRFDFLRKGLYTLYSLERCGSCPGGQRAVEVQVEIARGGELVEAPILLLNR
jgi:hypothetical protein